MKGRFLALDGIRGLAAALVLVRHAPGYFGSFQPSQSFLAVDLFFCLSGFVIAHAYQRRLDQGLRPWSFLKLRLVRLYPLYALGSALGVAAGAIAVVQGATEVADVVAAAAFGLVFLPTPAFGHAAQLYPLNFPAWSLFFELAANLAFAACWRHLTTRRLAAFVLIAAAALAALTLRSGSSEGGHVWASALVAGPRVAFSFGMGALIYRLRDRCAWLRLHPALALAAIAAALSFEPAAALQPLYQLFWIFAGFPLVILAAANRAPKRGAWAFQAAGVASFGIYALHAPLIALAERAAPALARAGAVTPWSGLVLLAVLAGAALILDRSFDEPVRRWLSRGARRPLAVEA